MSDVPDGVPAEPIDPTAVDLPPERQREILGLMERIRASDPRDVLGVPTGATPEEAKAAYFALARRFHPDQFFRKRLGTFQGRVEQVFTQLTRAFQEIAREEISGLRASGDPAAEQRPVPAPDELPDFADALPDLAVEGPQIGGRPRERFAKALERGNFEWAANALAALEAEEPHSLDVPKLRLELMRYQNEAAAKSEFLKGTVAHKKREWNQAYKHFEKAMAFDSRNATYVERAARSLAFQGEIKEAKQLAERAVELKPDDPDCHTTLGHDFQLAGMERNAKREFEAALKLDPKQDFARSQMRKLWWKG